MIRTSTIGLITVMVMSSFFVAGQNSNALMAWEVQADTLMARGDHKGAIDLLTRLISKTKFAAAGDYDLFYKRALAAFELGNFDAALRDANYYKTKSGDVQGNVLKVYIYEKMNDTKAALKQIDTLQQLYPSNAELTKWKVQLFFAEDQYADAKRELQDALKFSADPKLFFLLGLCHYYLGESAEAFAEFNKGIQANPSNMEGYIYPASLCLEDGLNEKALEFCERGLKQDGGDATLMFYKGIALYELKRPEEGCRFLARAFDKGVDDAADYLKEYCYGVEE